MKNTNCDYYYYCNYCNSCDYSEDIIQKVATLISLRLLPRCKLLCCIKRMKDLKQRL